MGEYIRIRVEGADAIARRFADSERRRTVLRTGMDANLNLIHAAVVPFTPVGVTGHLRSSWQTEVQWAGNALIGRLGSALIYAPVIERGRTPGATMPPPAAIATWVYTKLGPGASPFVIARSIGRKGIKGRRMLQKALRVTHSARGAIWAAAVRRAMEG
jgi:hypothetical protein